MARKRSKATSAKIHLETSADLRLSAFSSKLTKFQRELFDNFWKHFKEHDKWPLTRVIHSRIGTQKVRDALQSIGGDIIRELENPPSDTYQLSLIGVLMTSEGEGFRQSLLRYLEFLRDQFISHPEKIEFTNKEIQTGLSLSDEQTTMLGRLIRLGHSLGASGWNESSWTVRVPKEVEYLPHDVPLDKALDDWLFRHFQDRPVLAEEARQQWNQHRSAILSPALEQPQPLQAMATPIDALKKRYQVFVSSTYDDLKEERQHVIQALLETKCIPLGMELFPATSIEQWKLIKRVIDECDYYVVVVAGRYGSLNEAQIGYTEMEFDYALSIEKPVIGFFHSSPEALSLSKSEKTDLGRERLKKFTEKVKKRLCRPWTSAAELGSAVKSAILHELEFNPKPGWVRADAMAPSDQIEKYKQRIADLEERIKRKSHQESISPDGNPDVSLRFNVLLTNPGKEGDLSEVDVALSWDDLIVACSDCLSDSNGWSEYLREDFVNYFNKKISDAVLARLPKANLAHADIDRNEFEHVLHTFISKKWLKVASGSWTNGEGVWLKFTERGLHRLSEAKVKQRRAAA